MADEPVFSEWLDYLMKKNGWNQTEMARRANLSRSVIQKIVKRLVKKPDPETCVALANALDVSPVRVFRIAKHLPPATGIPEMDELEAMMSQLSTERREEVVVLVRSLLNFDKQRGKSVSQ
ncbi:MAG: helix-turn-helix transcriptional regulator [Chloroflexota bacterium]